jgi:hypothetical protein
MNFIELLFALLAKLVPMESDRRAQLSIDGNAWYKRLVESPEVPQNKALATIKEHANAWYTQVGFAIAYIFLLRELSDYLEGGDKDEDDSEENAR